MSQSTLTVHCPDHPDCKTTVTVDGEEVCAACQLETAKRSKTGRPKRCPNADCGPEELDVGSARISFRVGDDRERYWCKECGADFDEPVYAESEGAEKAVVTDGGRELSDAARQLEAEHAPDCGDCGARMDLRGIQRNGNDTGWLVQWTCPACEPERVKLESGLPDGYEAVPAGQEDPEQRTLTQAVTDGGISTSGAEPQTRVKYRNDVHPCEVCGEDDKQNINTVMRGGRNQFLCLDHHLVAREEGTALGAVKELLARYADTGISEKRTIADGGTSAGGSEQTCAVAITQLTTEEAEISGGPVICQGGFAGEWKIAGGVGPIPLCEAHEQLARDAGILISEGDTVAPINRGDYCDLDTDTDRDDDPELRADGGEPGGVTPAPRGQELTLGEFARENPAAVVVVVVGLAAWAVFLWWVIGGLT